MTVIDWWHCIHDITVIDVNSDVYCGKVKYSDLYSIVTCVRMAMMYTIASLYVHVIWSMKHILYDEDITCYDALLWCIVWGWWHNIWCLSIDDDELLMKMMLEQHRSRLDDGQILVLDMNLEQYSWWSVIAAVWWLDSDQQCWWAELAMLKQDWWECWADDQQYWPTTERIKETSDWCE